MRTDSVDGLVTAHTVLRVATQAVRAERGDTQPLSPAGCRRLAQDLADHLDAIAALLQTLGLPAVPARAGADDLRAVAEQLTLSASAARHAGERDSGPNHPRRGRRPGIDGE